MKTSHLLVIGVLLGIPAAGAYAAPEAAGAGESGAAQPAYQRRVDFVHKLLEESSAAQRVNASTNPEAKAAHDQARALYRKAVEAYRAGDEKAGAEGLRRATDTMFKAVRLAGRRQVVAAGQRADFDRRLKSIEALLTANERISQQKGTQAQHQHLSRAAHVRVTEAEGLLKQGQMVKARKVLDEAYVAIKMAVRAQRNGDTLVRSLHFATKKDEYHYELDRNDTHRMLIKMLLADRMKDARVRKRVDMFVDKANTFRAAAEKQAAAGDYAAAVRSLEDSTRELVRAIRNAGLFIPG